MSTLSHTGRGTATGIQRSGAAGSDNADRIGGARVALVAGCDAVRYAQHRRNRTVRDGPVSTGSFGGYLAGIFGPAGVVFEYTGEQQLRAARKCIARIRYRVPVEASKFQIKVGTAWVAVAYEGEIQVDPEAVELGTPDGAAERIADGCAPFCAAATTLEYQMAHVGDSDILLPRQSQLEIALSSGRHRLATPSRFRLAGNIRRSRKSYLSRGGSAGERGGAECGPRPCGWLCRIGLPVTLSLAEAIDSSTAAAGDPVAAKMW